MPIPIGQDANEITARRRGTALAARESSGELGRAGVAAGDVPVAADAAPWGEQEDEFRTIRLWYEKGSLLPRMAITVNRGGDESIVLDTPVANNPLPPGMLNVQEPPADAGWQVQVEELPALEEMEIDAPPR